MASWRNISAISQKKKTLHEYVIMMKIELFGIARHSRKTKPEKSRPRLLAPSACRSAHQGSQICRAHAGTIILPDPLIAGRPPGPLRVALASSAPRAAAAVGDISAGSERTAVAGTRRCRLL